MAPSNDTSASVIVVCFFYDVSDLLVAWHIQTVVLPSITVEESQFDPYDESQVDLWEVVPETTDATDEDEGE